MHLHQKVQCREEEEQQREEEEEGMALRAAMAEQSLEMISMVNARRELGR